MQRIKTLPWAEIVVVTAVIVMAAGVYVWAHRADPALEESKRRGAVLVQALEAYRGRNGGYPEQLDDLVPAYIEQVNQPTWGTGRWHYRRVRSNDASNAGDSATVEPMSHQAGFFELSVSAPGGYPVLYHDASTGSMILHN